MLATQKPSGWLRWRRCSVASAAAPALAAGANTRELMERMGHTSPAVALRYQHVMAGRDQAIAAALDELVQGAVLLMGAALGCWWWR